MAGDYDAMLCDVWGVLHNGVRAYPEAVEALARWRAAGRRTVLISNAPRSAARTRGSLAELGIGAELYDEVLTSGDVTCRLLASGEYGRRCYYLGPRRDLGLLQESRLTAATAQEAEVILCAGLHDDEIFASGGANGRKASVCASEQVEEYRPLLQSLAARGLTMVCANPDLVVQRGGELIACAGSLAALYQQLGGAAVYFGKPHERIYRRAWEMLETLLPRPVAKQRVLAVGDGIATDILGANRFGLDALFITGGIASAQLGADVLHPEAQRLARLCAEHDVRPVAAMSRLRWSPGS